MEADGEHNTRGTANTVTDGQRLDQLEDMVRELYRHVVGNEYSEGETPGPSGNFSNASMGFGANTVDEEFAVENAIDEKSIVTTPKDASDEESGVTGGNANTVTVDIDQRLNRLEDSRQGLIEFNEPSQKHLAIAFCIFAVIYIIRLVLTHQTTGLVWMVHQLILVTKRRVYR